MKKETTISTFLCILISTVAFSQNDQNKKNAKTPKFCSAEITLMNNLAENYALSRLSNDSIFVFPLSAKENKKEMQIDQELGIKAADIKKIFFRIDKKIVVPDSIIRRDSIYGATDGTTTRLIKENLTVKKFLQQERLSSLSAGVPIDAAGVDVMSLFVLPVFILVDIGLFLTDRGKKYSIKGKEEKFGRMVRQLKGKNKFSR